MTSQQIVGGMSGATCRISTGEAEVSSLRIVWLTLFPQMS
jgi:hypothetical protein